MNAFYKFAMTVMRLIMPLWYKIEAEGLENLPEESGYLFISNHRSMADPILIGVQNPDTQFCFLAKQELFSSGFIGWLLKKLGAVAVDRGAGDINALEEIEFRLQNGENALIFPEGTRSRDGKLGHFKTGAALIAAQTGAPVIPVAISFDDESLHFRSRIYIRYGAPFEIPRIDPADPSAAVLKQIRQEMTKNVSALLTMNAEASGGGTVIPAIPEKPVSAERNKESEVTEKDMSRNRKHHHNNNSDPLKQPEKKNAAEQAEKAADAAEEAVTAAAADAAEAASEASKTVADSVADQVAEVKADTEAAAEEQADTADDTPTADAASEDADFDDEDYDSEDDFDDDEEYDDEDDFDDEEEYDDEDGFDDDDEEYDGDDDFDDDEEYDDEDDFDDDEEYDDEDDFDDDEEYDDEDDFDDDEEYDDEDDFDDDDDEYDDEDDESDEEDDSFEEPAEKRSFLPFKFRNPFRKSDDDDDDDDDEDDYEDDADDEFDDEDDDLPEGAKSEDTFFKEDLAGESEDEDDDADDQPKKSGLFGGFSLKNPFARKADDEEAEDEDEEDESEDADDDDFEDDLDEEPVKVPVRPAVRPAGAAPRQPVRRPAPVRTPADDEFYDDDEFSNEYDEEDDEAAADGRRIDYGRIALILTFVILAIFAFDFCRRLWNDWRSQKGMLDIPSQSSAMVESMNGAESLSSADTPAVTTAENTQAGLETETTAPLETEVTSTSGSKAAVDNRTTQTVSVSSNDMHSGSLMLIDALHQQTAAPALITLGDTGVANVATVVAPTYHIDSEAGAQLNKWLTDFNTATGLGKQIWIYGAVEVGQTPPYSQQINERTTGLTVDFGISAPAGSGILFNPYTADGNYAWLNEHAAEYGFVLRYPADKVEQTGANGLSWHYRYVGVPHAAYMAENNLCLEEYLETLEDHTYDKEHLSVTVGETEYEMYYVPTAATGTETEIVYPVSADGSTPLISGDNKGGFVVACVKK